jgi:hypothetical protein
MKITNKDKKILQCFLMILIVGFTVINIFSPETINADLSITNLESKRQEMHSLNTSIEKNNQNISKTKIDLNKSQQDIKISDEKLNQALKKVNTQNLTLDIPSVLISLEQNAILNGVDLKIDYSSIKYSNKKNTNVEHAPPTSKEVKDSSATNKTTSESNTQIRSSYGSALSEPEFSSNSSTQNSPVVENNLPATNETDKVLSGYSMPNITGINVMVIPTQLTGGYDNIKSYLTYIEKIDYMAPGYINLESTGEKVNGTVIFNVYYGGDLP